MSSMPRLTRCLPIALLLLAACTQGGEKLDGQKMPAATAAQAHSQASQEPTAAAGLDLAGAHFEPPKTWKDMGPQQMRNGYYTFGPVEGDTVPAEVTVFYFGSDQGGDIESNIRRWVGQMEPPAGMTIEQSMRRSKLTTTEGLPLHFVELDGTFQRSMGGGPMTGGRTESFPGWRMVGAIVEAPEGNVFFKLVGPAATARAMEVDYRTMLAHAQRI